MTNGYDQSLQTQYEQTFKRIQALEEMLAQLSKDARETLKKTGMWQQEFHGNEIVGAMAVLPPVVDQLVKKSEALHIAIAFIGMFENDDTYGDQASDTLEKINLLISGETVQESIDRQSQGVILT